MTAPDPAAIARRLTPAMRRALLKFPADGGWLYCDQYEANQRTLGMLIRAHLVHFGPARRRPCRLFPIGLAVREIVAREDGHAS